MRRSFLNKHVFARLGAACKQAAVIALAMTNIKGDPEEI
jgi:hypothetical protein